MTNYFENYYGALNEAAKTVDQSALDKAYDLLLNNMGDVVIFGNGGSASIADHFCCDFVKGIRTDTNLLPKCTSLSSNGPLITALANDFKYDDIFWAQISYYRPRLAIAVSSGGNSINVKNGLIAAGQYGAKTLALVGFDGGEILKRKIADVVVHVQSENYGIVEDSHMMILHSLIQKIRIEHSNRGNSLKL